jgi:branched-chain amino acid transport system permease protein
VTELANVLLRSAQTGAIYASVALGLSLTIGSTGIFNFAHGEAVMIGAMLGALLWTSAGVPVLAAAAIAIGAAAVLGILTDVLAVRPLGRHAHATAMVSTLAVALLVSALFTEAVVRGAGGSEVRHFPDFLPWTEVYDVGGVLVNPVRLFPIVSLVILVVVLRWWLGSTHYGRAISTLADDRDAAAMRGLPVRTLQTITLAVGAALAAAAGFAAGPITQASVSMGVPLTIKGFVAVAIGGMPRLSGAIAGGFALGAIEQFTAGYLDTRLQDPIILIAVVALLYVRPRGLLGQSFRAI